MILVINVIIMIIVMCPDLEVVGEVPGDAIAGLAAILRVDVLDVQQVAPPVVDAQLTVRREVRPVDESSRSCREHRQSHDDLGRGHKFFTRTQHLEYSSVPAPLSTPQLQAYQ
jgi:hypothetical protein